MSQGFGKVLDARWRALSVVAVAALVLIFTQGAANPAAKVAVDINSATQAELEAVKGIGPVTAKNIIDNRPYKSLADLKKAGLSSKEIAAFKPYLTVKPAPAAPAPAAAPQPVKAAEPATAKKMPEAKPPAPAPGTPVDLNTADLKTLEALPGVGPTLAKRIVEARPLNSLDDLGKVKGMTKAKVAALKDKVTVGPAASAAPAAKPTPEPAAAKPAPVAEKPLPAPEPGAKPTTTAAPKTKPETATLAPGQRVNINTASQEELEKIPGIGPVKAKAIIAGRPYKTPEDIMKVRGIKEGTFRKIKDLITVQ